MPFPADEACFDTKRMRNQQKLRVVQQTVDSIHGRSAMNSQIKSVLSALSLAVVSLTMTATAEATPVIRPIPRGQCQRPICRPPLLRPGCRPQPARCTPQPTQCHFNGVGGAGSSNNAANAAAAANSRNGNLNALLNRNTQTQTSANTNANALTNTNTLTNSNPINNTNTVGVTNVNANLNGAVVPVLPTLPF